MVPLNSLIISQQIRKVVLKVNPNFYFGEFIIEDDGTFPLGRMEKMMKDKLYGTTERPPINVSKEGRYY